MGIVCKSFPYWGWIAGAGEAKVVWIAGGKDGQLEEVDGQLEEGISHWDGSGRMEDWIGKQAAVDIVCFDNVTPGSLHAVWRLSGVEVVIWFGRYSRSKAPVGWTRSQFAVVHAELGGITDGRFIVHVATRTEQSRFHLRSPVGVGMFLDSVIDRTAHGVSCQAPAREEVESRLLELKSEGGQFVVPSVFSKTGFVRRKLTLKERSLAWDLPAGILKRVPEQLREELVKEIRLPFKIRVHALQSLRPVWINPSVKSLEVAPSPKKERPSAPSLTPPIAPTVNTGEPAESRDAKATKADDAEVPHYLWDERLGLDLSDVSGEMRRRVTNALGNVRVLLHKRWVSKLARSFWRWVVEEKRQGHSVVAGVYTAGLAAISHALASDWWEWSGGSAVFFWRWPAEFRDTIRAGLPPRFVAEPPRNRKPQRLPKEMDTLTGIVAKVEKLRARKYIAPGKVTSLINMFPVPKGANDIRLVFDATASGLNETLYSPWFALPTVAQMTRTVDVGYYCGDNDFGEMFYNFWLHEDLRPYTGIDLTKLIPGELDSGRGTLWEQFTRPTMGLSPSPYQAVQGALQFKGLVLGRGTSAVSDPSNVFHWVAVVTNLPGTKEYNPGKPWIFKVRYDGAIAVEIHLFVDDGRITGPTWELVWQGGSKVAKMASWYGLQDAARKRRAPSQTPGAWSGAIVSTTADGVFQSVSQERWDKTRAGVEWIRKELEGPGSKDSTIEFKPLERIRGFLVYVGQTYRSMVPYLKGIHLTLDSWRSNRDEDGWRLTAAARKELEEEGGAPQGEGEAPPRVKAAPRLAQDLQALAELLKDKSPPIIPARPSLSARVVIGFGDASGNGFGISEAHNEADYEEICFEYGVWKEEVSKESSNFREFNNFVSRVESGLKDGSIKSGTEFFLFTDNFVTERAFFKGTSKSRTLFELVLRLRKLEMHGEIFLHLIWCAGTRMIAQGTDGLSWGDLANGVLVGQSMLDYVPIHRTACARSPALVDWVNTWCPSNAKILEEADWFDEAHTASRPLFWFPAPAICDVAVEQLCEAHHTREAGFHCLIVPNLMTSRWRKQLRKASDVMFTIPVGASFWGEKICEGWSWQGTWSAPCQECGKEMKADEGLCCANFGYSRGPWQDCKGLWHWTCYRASNKDQYPRQQSADEEERVFEEDDLKEEERFRVARRGDHHLCPFQCDLCHFRNMRASEPDENREEDQNLLIAVRRATLDSFWARERSTVEQNWRERKHVMEAMRTFGFDEAPDQLRAEPYPAKDTWGMFQAVSLLHRSLDAGKNSSTIQFGTMRRLRSYFTNFALTKPDGVQLTSITGQLGAQFFSDSPTHSYWFKRFLEGCHRRMGDNVRPDRAVTIDQMLRLQQLWDEDWVGALPVKRLEIATVATYCLAGFVGGLRGEEIPKAELESTIAHLDDSLNHPRKPHITLGLQGRVKGERGDRCHLLPLALETHSGLQMAKWLCRLIDEYALTGVTRGPVFRVNRKGKISRGCIADYNGIFQAYLSRVQSRWPNVLSSAVDVTEFGLMRSLRRGSTSQARNRKVPETVIDTNNRWRKVERARGKQVSVGMMEHYSDVVASIETLLIYSESL